MGYLRLWLRYERLRAAGRRWMGYLRLRLRYERLRAAGRGWMEYLRLRLRYERLRAAGRRWMEYLRLRLRYERLRAAGRHSCGRPCAGAGRRAAQGAWNGAGRDCTWRGLPMASTWPWFIASTRSDTLETSAMSCSTISTVMPSACCMSW